MSQLSKIIVLCLFTLAVVNTKAQQHDLNYFLEQAKLNSPLLQRNRADNELVKLDMQQTERILKSPVINLESNLLFAPIISHDNNIRKFEFTSPGATNYIGYDQAFTDGGQYQAHIALSQPLFTGSSLRTYKNKNEIATKINEDALNLNVHELEQLVGYQFIICRKSKAQLENTEALNSELTEQIESMKKLVESAIFKYTDKMLLELELQNGLAQQKTNQEDFSNNLYDLYLLCGIKDSLNKNINWTDFKINNATTIENSHFLNSFRLDSLNIVANQSITELKYKPQLNLFANAGMNAIYLPALNRFGFSTGLNFSWNIYDGHQRKIEVDKSNVNLRTIAFEKDNFITQKQQNLDKIQSQIEGIEAQIRLSDNLLKIYDELYRAYQKQLAAAGISAMDFKTFLRDYKAKNQERSMLDMQKQILINTYNYWNY